MSVLTSGFLFFESATMIDWESYRLAYMTYVARECVNLAGSITALSKDMGLSRSYVSELTQGKKAGPSLVGHFVDYLQVPHKLDFDYIDSTYRAHSVPAQLYLMYTAIEWVAEYSGSYWTGITCLHASDLEVSLNNDILPPVTVLYFSDTLICLIFSTRSRINFQFVKQHPGANIEGQVLLLHPPTFKLELESWLSMEGDNSNVSR
jgi:hypothetical protein